MDTIKQVNYQNAPVGFNSRRPKERVNEENEWMGASELVAGKGSSNAGC
jgi:hypothetical protein